MFHALVMAGGSGTRMWPLSRTTVPKQALALTGDRTMFQTTVERLHPLILPANVHVVTNAAMAPLFREQMPAIPDRNYIIEPYANDSGPAAALGLTHIHQVDPEAVVAILAADHYISDVAGFLAVLDWAQHPAKAGFITTLGIQPTSPSTGFGYVERGPKLDALSSDACSVFTANGFREKPSADVALAYVLGGAHFWNSGMFIVTTATGLQEFARQQPQFSAALGRLQLAIDTPGYNDALLEAWGCAPRKSLDFAIMEHAEKVAVIPMNVGWSDIGSWASLLDILDADDHGNVILGHHIAIDTRDSLVLGHQRVIATIGVSDLIVVDTPDALLICARDRVQDVKQVVEKLKASGRTHIV